ncbi:hypothetical protein A5784_14170 [Mycobacterium sp. 852013-50091_SCH5140682]|uniref:hypothetical protein n=1 Tax=Mycobacterium sp. 852013-50091_SCH5140682 TaxID=1834109 RepID=UPI0007E9B808|nr:hypothetical protein [Mycobacterium sp. 852013-50091_SCH5140682]OBC03374.1 hypothetical protein A5784_14170 [Mycobacterium sp. 852013-50091_SCH5140682]
MTTPVGSIKLDLKIDGSDLPAETLREIQGALAPVLAEIQRRLEEVERDYQHLSREAEKSATKQVTANEAVAESVEHVGDEHTKTAAKAKSSATLTTRQINAVTRALDRQAAAWSRLAVAQAAAAAAPKPTAPPPPPRTPGGGGGSRGGGGGRRGGGGRGGGFFTSPLGVNSIALGVGSLPAASVATLNLVGAVQQLVQVGGLLPGVIGGIVSSVGTAKLGFLGLSDAVTAAWEASKSGDPKDLLKAVEAQKDLAESAKATVKAIVAVRPQVEHLQRDIVQQNMFEGIDKAFTDLTNKTMPTLEKGLGGISKAWNGTFKELGRVGGLDSTQSFLDKLFGNTAEAQTRANAAIEPLVHAIGTLTSESSDFLPRLADGLKGVTTRFDNWITESVQNGNLDKWINQGIDAAGHLGETFLNIGKILNDLTTAAGGDGGFLKWLEDATTNLHNFLTSTEGQTKLTEFFREGKEQLGRWIEILKNVGSTLVDVYNGAKQWADVLLPILKTVTDIIAAMPGGVTGVVTAFLAWKTITGITDVIGHLTNMGGLLDGMPGKAKGSATGFASAFNPVTLGLTALFTTITMLVEKIKSDNDYVKLQGDPNVPQEVKDQATVQKFYPDLGRLPNASDPANLGMPEKGSLLYEQMLQDVKDGKFQIPGVDPANADATFAQIAEQAANARKNTELLANDIKTLPDGQVVLKEDTPEAIQRVKDLGYEVQKLPDGNVTVRVVFRDPNGNPIDPSQLRTPGFIPAFPGDTTVPKGGRAEGGVLPGYSPGVDNMLVPMSGGEGVIIPEAMRALGSRWLYNLNSSFRSGLSRRGYAGGGIVGFDDGGVVPGLPQDTTVLGLLSQIRDLLAGKGGTAGNPLAATAANTSNMSTAVDKAATSSGTQLGPFGTPIKPRHRGYEAAAAAIQALGGDPEKWLGADPATVSMAQGGILPNPITAAGLPGGGADLSRYATVLAAFAKSGNLGSDLTGLGLDANDPVVKAITTARNKKKGRLSDDTIADLVTQVVGGGGYTGTLDSTNSSLISSLQTFREKLMKPAGSRSRGSAAAATGLPMSALPAGVLDPVTAYAQAHSGGQYSWGASDLAAGLSDCSGAVSDLVEIITQGQATSKRLFSTADAGSVLSSLGAVSGAVPGALQIGWSAEHMRATLPNGVNFESGGGTGQGATYGGNAQGAAGMPNIMSLPVNGVPLGAGGLPGTSGGVVPVYVTNFDGQMRGAEFFKPIADAAATAAGGAAADVGGDVLTSALGVGFRDVPKDTVDAERLLAERNPNALAALAGFKVGDYNRTGSQGAADNLTQNDGPAFNAQGQLYSDTSALIDRTFTNLSAQIKASFDQMKDVLSQVRDKLTEEALKPVLKSAVAEGVSEVKDAALASIGTTMGQAAGPPIAEAVNSKVSAAVAASQQNGGGSSTGQALVGALFASGGGVNGGTPGKDSVPAMLMPGEHVLTTSDVARMGGQQGVYAFRQALARTGGVRGFATGGGVNVNNTVGAEFFGVSQIPVLGAIVNLLVRILLGVLGVNIEARDTLNEMTDEFRKFRGDFQAFDASGRLLNDTSALMDRSQSSEEIAAQERIRILKIVLQALIKYIIEKVIVPIAKAVANAAINAGAAAAGAAVNSQAPGAGGIVSALISSGGSAGVDILADIGSEIAVQSSAVIIDMVAEGLQSYFPDAVGSIFGGAMMENLIAAPLAGALAMPLAMIGALTGGLTGLFAPLSALVGGASFDNGGIANGIGVMPKATIRPERVLNPEQTALFARMVSALERNGGGHGGQTIVQIGEGAIQVAGGPEAGRNVRDGLLELMS